MPDTDDAFGDPIPDHLRDDMAWAKDRKNRLVGDTTIDENDDITPSVVFYRNGKPIATVICSQVDRDQALLAAHIGIPGYGAEEVRLLTDSHYSKQAGPKPGTRWEPGQMQNLCDNENACATGLITDTLMLFVAKRDGNMGFLNMPYHVHKTARQVKWVDEEHFFGAAGEKKVAGLVPDSVSEAFAKTPLFDLASGKAETEVGPMPSFEEFGLNEEEARAHMDCAVTKMLLAADCGAVMLFPDSDVAAEIVKASFEEDTLVAALSGMIRSAGGIGLQ